MRKAKSKATRNAVWAIFIILIMTLSVIGFIFGEYGTTKKRYNGLTFKQLNNGWTVKVNNQQIFFNYLPADVESINLSQNIAQRLSDAKMFYTTQDPDTRNADIIAEVQYYFGQDAPLLDIYVINGLTKNLTGNLIISCENSTQFVPVIEFREGNETKIYEENGCIIAMAQSPNEIYALKDRILYQIAKIMK